MNKKKLIAIVLCIIIVVAVSLIVFTRSPPSDEETSYSLRLNYNIGEKLIYRINATSITSMVNEYESVEFIYEMEVLDFDGENYTIQQTVSLEEEPEYSPIGIVKINQTGYVVEFVDYSIDYFGSVLTSLILPTFGVYSQEKVELGESWEGVFDIEKLITVEESRIDFWETTNYTLSEVTGETLKILFEMTAYMTLFSELGDVTTTIDINGTICLDAVTYSLAEFYLTELSRSVWMGETTELECAIHCQLVSESETPEPEPEPEPEVMLTVELSSDVTDLHANVWHDQIVKVTSTGFEGYFDIMDVTLTPTTDYDYVVENYRKYKIGETWVDVTDRGFYVNETAVTTIYFDLKINEYGYEGNLQVEICTEDKIYIKSDMLSISVTDFPSSSSQ